MSCVVDKADNLRVTETDAHFSDFTGVSAAEIYSGGVNLLDILMPKERETVMKELCKKDSPYVYIDFHLKNKNNEYIYIHCLSQSIPGTTRSRLALADISQSQKKSELIKEEADAMNSLIDLVEGGVCLFKVTQDMHFEPIYMNSACAKFFGTSSEYAVGKAHRLEELIHPDDKSRVFQAVGNSMATKKPINLEIRVITHKNSFIWVKLDSAIQRYDTDGCPVFHAVFTDISHVKEAEEQADSRREVMIKIFKNLPGPLFCTDINNPFILDIVSEDFIKLIGYSRQELFEGLGGDLTHLIVAEDAERAEREIIEGAKHSDTVKTFYTLKLRGGKLVNLVDKRKIIEGNEFEKATIGILREASAIKIDEELGL